MRTRLAANRVFRLSSARRFFLFLPLLLAIAAPSQAAGFLVSELTDRRGDSVVPYCDFLAARIWQVDATHYQLEMELAAPVPYEDPPDEAVHYLWCLDTDQNPSTGYSINGIGADYTVRIVFDEDRLSVGGAVEQVEPPAWRGPVTKFVDGVHLWALLPLPLINGDTTFNWTINTLQVPYLPGLDSQNGSKTATAYAQPIPPTTPQRVVVQEALCLRTGNTESTLEIFIQDHLGASRRTDGNDTVELFPFIGGFWTQDGTVGAEQGTFGPTFVSVRVNGRLSDNVTRVMAGTSYLSPPVLHISPFSATQNSGRFRLVARDAFGTPIDLAGHTVEYRQRPNVDSPQVAVRTTQRMDEVEVAAIAGQLGNAQVDAAIDGIWEDGYAHVRVTTGAYEIPAFTVYQGEHVFFGLPSEFSCDAAQGLTIDEMVTKYEVLDVSDFASEVQRSLSGSAISMYGEPLAVAAIADDDTFHLGGFNGNPIGLQLRVTAPSTSCVQVDYTGMPHYFVLFHETGHNCLGINYLITRSFPSESPVHVPFHEGMASILATYVQHTIVETGNHPAFNADTVDSLGSSSNYMSLSESRHWFGAALEEFEKNPSIDALTPNVMDGMLFSLIEQYGWEKLPRLFSIFLPSNDSFNFDPAYDNQTFLVACVSAAFEVDLARKFEEDWGIPVDGVFFSSILPELEYRAMLRDCPVPDPVVRFGAQEYTIDETTTSTSITVVLDKAPDYGDSAQVRYSVTGGTATAGVDFHSMGGILHFGPGEKSQTFAVRPVDDSIEEATETIVLSLTSPLGCSLSTHNGSATIQLVDDDYVPRQVDFDKPVYSVPESNDPVVITVRLDKPPGEGRTTSVDYATSDSSAVSGKDYSSVSGTLTFAATESEKTFAVPLVNDRVVERTEQFLLNLSSPDGAVLAKANHPAVVEITDDDAPTVSFSASSYSIGEADGSAEIAVTLSVPPGVGVTASVDYETSDGVATHDDDYGPVCGVITFLSGETRKTFAVPIVNDSIHEGIETIRLYLRNADLCTLTGGRSVANVVIIDDDPEGASGGDVNEDGLLDAVDVQIVINAALGLDVGQAHPDVNGSSTTDAVDVQLVINAVLGVG